MSQPAELLFGDIADDLCSPFFDAKGALHVVLQNSGDIVTIGDEGDIDACHSTAGQPSGACFSRAGTLFIADFGHGSVLAAHNNGSNEQEIVVSVYEDKPLRGPNSICMVGTSLFFTDSGPFGETGLHSPSGSVFCIVDSPSGQVLKPISQGNLAYPSGIVATSNGTYIFVAETMTNRVLRFFQQPHGVYHGSVFCQLSGGVGPTALAYDESTGYLYVAKFEQANKLNKDLSGEVVIFSRSGKEVGTLSVPGTEISGLGVNVSNRMLYITEKSTKSVYVAPLLK